MSRYCLSIASTLRIFALVFRSKYSDGNSAMVFGLGLRFITLPLLLWSRGDKPCELSGQDIQERLHNLGRSIGEFNYVIDRAPRDFPLLPEILTRKGENLIKLRRAPEGVRALFQAIELKPDYWPPYAHISDYYKSFGEIAKARELLEEGLANAPNTKLKQRLADLDNQEGSARAVGVRRRVLALRAPAGIPLRLSRSASVA